MVTVTPREYHEDVGATKPCVVFQTSVVAVIHPRMHIHVHMYKYMYIPMVSYL